MNAHPVTRRLHGRARRHVPALDSAQRALLDEYLPEATTRRIGWSGGNTQVIEAGSGPPLLFVHGGFGQATEWIPLWPRLAARHRLLAVDRPGHGLADPHDYPDADTREVAVRFLGEVLEALELERVPVVGNSMGGRWALELALRQPDRTSTVVLVGAPAGSTRRVPMPLLAMRWPITRPLARRTFEHADPRGVRRFFGRVLVAHPERLSDAFVLAKAAGQRRNWRSMLSFAERVMTFHGIHPHLLLADVWKRLEVPVRFVWGKTDAFDSPATGRTIVAGIPGSASIDEIPGAGHLPWLDDPPAVAEAVEEAVRSPP